MYDPNKPGAPPIYMDKHSAALLAACGYEATFCPAQWEDVGGPENGPLLFGHPDMWVWSLDQGSSTHEIVVIGGRVADVVDMPNPPDGWEEQF